MLENTSEQKVTDTIYRKRERERERIWFLVLEKVLKFWNGNVVAETSKRKDFLVTFCFLLSKSHSGGEIGLSSEIVGPGTGCSLKMELLSDFDFSNE